MKYKNQLIAFIDVLGFSKMVFASENSEISEYFNFVQSKFKTFSKNYNLNYFMISDSIVINCEQTESQFRRMSEFLALMQANLLSKKI